MVRIVFLMIRMWEFFFQSGSVDHLGVYKRFRSLPWHCIINGGAAHTTVNYTGSKVSNNVYLIVHHVVLYLLYHGIVLGPTGFSGMPGILFAMELSWIWPRVTDGVYGIGCTRKPIQVYYWQFVMSLYIYIYIWNGLCFLTLPQRVLVTHMRGWLLLLKWKSQNSHHLNIYIYIYIYMRISNFIIKLYSVHVFFHLNWVRQSQN